MIKMFLRSIIVALIYALFMPSVIFGLVAIFVCEIISRIVYAESAIAVAYDLDEVKEKVNDILKATKEYILG